MAKGKPLDVEGLDWFYENTPSNRRPRALDREEAEARDHLTDRVMALPRHLWENAGFPEEIEEALDEHDRIPVGARGALARQRNRLSGMWVQADVPRYEALVDELLARAPADAPETPAEGRLRALLEGGADALTALFDAAPGLDRQRVRQLVQNARKSKDSPAGRRAVAELLTTLAEVPDED
jgi:ribosomal 50S subunit-associated protein YjgA (DUF615 family)